MIIRLRWLTAAIALSFSAWVPIRADAFSTQMKIVGSLEYGQVVPHVAYHNPEKYRAFRFAGNKGDRIAVWVHSEDGDPIVWVLDSAFKVIAFNDDATSSTVDAHVSLILPQNADPAVKTYYIVFRDYDMTPASFKVELSRNLRRPPAQYLSPRFKPPGTARPVEH
jgi:hypothetical protein